MSHSYRWRVKVFNPRNGAWNHYYVVAHNKLAAETKGKMKAIEGGWYKPELHELKMEAEKIELYD